MKSSILFLVLLSAQICCFKDIFAQNALQKKDHLITAGLNLDYSQTQNEHELALGIGLQWQYIASEKWSFGIGLQLTKSLRNIQQPITGEENIRENYYFSPNVIVSRIYSIDNKWSLALANSLGYSKYSNQYTFGYNLHPILYYKFKPQWLISASTTLGSISYSKTWGLVNDTYLDISLRPRINSFLPSFSINYLL